MLLSVEDERWIYTCWPDLICLGLSMMVLLRSFGGLDEIRRRSLLFLLKPPPI